MTEEANAEATVIAENTGNTHDKHNSVINIKQEKIDAEIEKKIHICVSNNVDDMKQHIAGEQHNADDLTSADDETEDVSSSDSSQKQAARDEEEKDLKKLIEPVKSSNEILMEIFNVFNAAPPKELFDDKNLVEKSRKRKKEKKKKHKKSKSDGECSLSNAETGSQAKHKKKKHKHKHKDGKGKKKNKDKDKSKSKEKKKDRRRDKSRDDDKNNSENGDDRKHIQIKLEKKMSSKDAGEKHLVVSTDHRNHHDNGKRVKSEDKDRRSKHHSNPFYKSSSYDRELKNQPLENVEKYCKNGGKIEIKIKKDFRGSGLRIMTDNETSEVSLSDEESYLRGKEKLIDYSKYKSRNIFYANTERSRDGNDKTYVKERSHKQDLERERDDSRRRQRIRGAGGRFYQTQRSRSRSRSRDLGIDKKRLLEIARKNAITMLKRGSLPGCANMTEDVKDRVLLKMRYGGRTVEDLTEFCKKISNGEHLSDLSSDEGSDVDKSGNAKAFHHPFQLKEREPIVMHIRNSKPLVPFAKTVEDTKTITMQFPVSSGQQHRMTEAWVPVEPKENLSPLPALPVALQSTNIFKAAVVKNALGKPLPTEGEQEPAFKSVVDISAGIANNEEKVDTNAFTAVPQPVPPPLQFAAPLEAPPLLPPVPPVPPPLITIPPPSLMTATQAATPAFSNTVANTFEPDVPVPSSTQSIFPQTPFASFDVSAIISKRLSAMRRLQENPTDAEALKLMYNSQKEMSSWAASKHMPGQFTGSTGANILKPNELSSGPQVWARKDQLTSTNPVTGGMGMHLLQKMGWRPGEGLGRDKNGSLQPLLLDVKLDKRGLVAQEDIKQPKKRSREHSYSGQPSNHNLQEKHPVCLLNELATKYKWTPPLYSLVHENGPSHSRMFLFSVQLNNETYTPTKLSNTKKDAKLAAAKLCLQQMGILPRIELNE